MTDGEPEPFRMSTEPDAEDAPAEDAPDADAPSEDVPAEDAPTAAAPAESIADLIDEASRTAALQAEAEATGDAPEDRSGDVWGDGGSIAGSGESVWQEADDVAASNVWDTGDDDEVMWGTDAPAVEERTDADPTSQEPPPAAGGPPAAAEGMLGGDDELEPETFTFAVDDGGVTPAPAPAGAPGPGQPEEPETFSFPAGPDTTAPAAVPDHTEAVGEEEPDAFSFAVSDEDAAPPAESGAVDASPVEEWTVPGADAADEEHEDVNTDVWTFSVTTDQDTPLADEDTPLADSASPRDDAGWHDLEAEQEPTWSVPDLPVRAHAGDEDEPEGFAVAVGDEDDDAPWSSPALPDEDAPPAEDEPPADVVAAEVHDALGDLLGNGEEDAVVETGGPAAAAPEAAAPAPVLDDLDGLDHFDDLEHLDDMAAAAVPGVGDEAAATTEDAPGPGGDEDDDEDDEEPEIEQPLDAPTAARKVMEPGSVTFSSGGKKKKRGLFG